MRTRRGECYLVSAMMPVVVEPAERARSWLALLFFDFDPHCPLNDDSRLNSGRVSMSAVLNVNAAQTVFRSQRFGFGIQPNSSRTISFVLRCPREKTGRRGKKRVEQTERLPCKAKIQSVFAY